DRVEVVVTGTRADGKSNPLHVAVHNVYVTPDSKYVVSGSLATSVISVIDSQTNHVVWSVKLSSGIRPMTFTKNPDGSTKEIIAQLSNFHGFVVVDFAARSEINRITLPDSSNQQKRSEEHTSELQSRVDLVCR